MLKLNPLIMMFWLAVSASVASTIFYGFMAIDTMVRYAVANAPYSRSLATLVDQTLVGFLARTDGAGEAFAIYSNPFSRKLLAHPFIETVNNWSEIDETVNNWSEIDSLTESLSSRTRRRFASW